jgi:hypothetical protein
VRPARAGGVLTSPQDLVVYLPDGDAGRTARCGASGLRGGSKVTDAVPRTVTVALHQVVTCALTLEAGVAGDAGASMDATARELGAGPDGAAGDGPASSDGMRAGDGGPAVDAAVGPGDGAAVTDTASITDAPLTIDVAAMPDAGVMPDAASPVPDAASPPPDAPANAPPDAPPDLAPPLAAGCADGVRQAFLDRASFPTVAGCGAALIPYSQALATAASVCAAGWHWCRAEEVGALPATPAPGQVSGTCGWLDSTQATCVKRNAYNQPRCAGSATMSLAAGGPTGGANLCTGVDLSCMEPWKLAVALDRWTTASMAGAAAGTCVDHVGFQCASGVGGASCWVTCCRD